jgi:hypothetical protein
MRNPLSRVPHAYATLPRASHTDRIGVTLEISSPTQLSLEFGFGSSCRQVCLVIVLGVVGLVLRGSTEFLGLVSSTRTEQPR